jgi:hypothetical protein
MTVIHVETALLPDGLAGDVRITFSAAGIKRVDRGAAPQPGDERHRVWVGGARQVEGGRHRRREAISARFAKAMAELAV